MKTIRTCMFVVGLTLAVQTSWAQSVEVQLKPILTLGDSKDAEPEYLFERPRLISSDADGNFYVADGRSARIRLFDPNGKFVRELGEEGAAPGEFKHVSAMTVTRDRELVVLDSRNDRVTVFDRDGKRTSTRTLELAASIWDVVELGSGQFAVNYHSYSNAGTHVLHVMSDDFSDEVHSVLARDELYQAYRDVPYVNDAWYRMGDYFHFTDDQDNLYVVPEHYDGTIYRYHASDGYAAQKVFSHRPFPEPAVEEIELSEREAYRARGLSYATHHSARNGNTENAAFLRRQSTGWANMPNGALVHFYFEKRDSGSLFAEVIDASGTFLGEAAVRLPSAPDRDVYFQVLHSTDSGVIYTVDNAGGYPVIRVYQVSFKII